MTADSIRAHAVFPMTNWSLLSRAGKSPDEAQRDALNALLTRYWPALRAHLVIRKRIDPVHADDFVQGFIHSKILERDLIAKADSERGRFRNLLLTALDNYIRNELEKRGSSKRAPERAVGLFVEREDTAGGVRQSPETVFEVEWARQLLAVTIERMKEECAASRRDDLWGLFEMRILAPILEGGEPANYTDLVRRFGFQSPAQASNVLMTAKRMFARLLREIISEYALCEEEVEAEIQELYRFLSGS